MLASRTRDYLIAGLGGTPDVLEALVGGIPPDSPLWDARPDSERFTLREVLGHLAASEPRWCERALLMRDEDNPTFPTQPIQTDFPDAEPRECLARFRAFRAAFIELLTLLPLSDWERVGQSAFLGSITIEAQAVFVLTHDGYHTRQIAEWRRQMSA